MINACILATELEKTLKYEVARAIRCHLKSNERKVLKGSLPFYIAETQFALGERLSDNVTDICFSVKGQLAIVTGASSEFGVTPITAKDQ
jgi:hypothetical protein